MECAKIREHLSEYIDGMLDKQTNALLEEHLLTCKDCSEELDSLKTIVKELGALESVKAPPDLLDSLHQRIESRFTLSKLIHSLFIIPKTKIPFQLATVTVTAILVFVIVYRVQLVKEIFQEPTVSKQIIVGGKAQKDLDSVGGDIQQKKIKEESKFGAARPTPPKYASIKKYAVKEDRKLKKVDEVKLEKKATAKPSVKKKPKVPESIAKEVKESEKFHEQKPIVLALLIEEKRSHLVTAPGVLNGSLEIRRKLGNVYLGSSIDKTAPPSSRITEADKKKRYGRIMSSRQMSLGKAAGPPEGEFTGSNHDKVTAMAKPSSSAGGGELKFQFRDMAKPLNDTDSRLYYIEKIFLKVKDLISRKNGKLISLKYKEKSELLESISAEIPIVNYNSFCEELRSIAVLKLPLPEISNKDQEAVQILIKLITSM